MPFGIIATGSASTRSSINAQVDLWIRKVERSVADFSDKDRRRIVRKAARPVVKRMRAIAPNRAKRKGRYRSYSTRINYRYPKGEPKIGYQPGNLRRSIKILPFRRTADAYAGPQFARKDVPEYGGVGQPVDGYYAAMIFGSAVAFRKRVIEPAARATESQVIARLKKESRAAIKKAAERRGVKTN